jgi:hypothetical protein
MSFVCTSIDGVSKGRNERTYGSSDPIYIYTIEGAHFVKVDITELCLLNHLRIESTFEFHHVQEHLVVCSTREENLASIKLEEGTSDRPHIERGIIGNAQN